MPFVSARTPRFRKLFGHLSEAQKRAARRAYAQWLRDPTHPSLHFKPVKAEERIWSVRINDDWRALCRIEGSVAVWFWIGPHKDYDALLAQGGRRASEASKT